MMKKQDSIPDLSQKEAVVLGVLLSSLAHEMFGLEIVEQSSGMLKRGTIYVTLQRMEQKGILDSRSEARPKPEIGIPRRMYRVTGLGESAFKMYKVAYVKLGELIASTQ